jgi:hypothetical protein
VLRADLCQVITERNCVGHLAHMWAGRRKAAANFRAS